MKNGTRRMNHVEKENSKLCGSRIACSLTLKLETVYGMVQRNGERDEKEDATDESYGITCMIERANYMWIEFACFLQ